MLGITTKTYTDFLQAIKADAYLKTPFCFLIGAGCSVSSGFPSGSELAIKWYCDLTRRTIQYKELPPDIQKAVLAVDDQQSKSKVVEYLSEQGLLDKVLLDRSCEEDETPSLYDLLRVLFVYGVADSYGLLAQWYFGSDYDYATAFFQEYNDHATPSIGYTYLSKILCDQNRDNKVVITTNFDTLLYKAIPRDALFIDTVATHSINENELWYSQIKRGQPLLHPLLITVHNNLHHAALLNTAVDTRYIDNTMFDLLDQVMQRRTLIVLGYSGQDIALMDYLARMKGSPRRIYWLQYSPQTETDALLTGKDCSYLVRRVLNRFSNNSYLIPFKNFDNTIKHIMEIVVDQPQVDEKMKADGLVEDGHLDLHTENRFYERTENSNITNIKRQAISSEDKSESREPIPSQTTRSITKIINQARKK